jgi:putative hydrolase of the HAD superfamily
MSSLQALAVDFGGTLARPGPSPDGDIVASALADMEGMRIPDIFPATFDAVTRRIRHEDRERGVQSAFSEQLRQAARECGALIPDLRAATEAVFSTIPDATVDPAAAHALRLLHDRGLRCVLACDTQRPETIRRRTLSQAGIADVFHALVLSSTVGARKPHPRFYDAVVQAAGTQPEHILFVGDTPAKDATGPVTYGMRAVLIGPAPHSPALPEQIGVIDHFAELPAYLESTGDL